MNNNRQAEKFNRALQKFLNDNPDIDLDVAQKEFINLYNSGQYKLDDDFSKAEEIFENALELTDENLVIDALKKAVDICRFHFEAKGELAILETKDDLEKISKLEDILAENKHHLEKTEEIDFDNFERTLWLNINVRPYLRNMFKLMMLHINKNDYDNGLEVANELIRLDPENHQDQEVFNLICLLGKKEFDLVLEKSEEYFKVIDHSKFLFISFLASIYKGDDKKALEYALKLAKVNISYLCLILGVVNLEPEDYEDIFNNQYVALESFEDAARVFFSLNQIIINNIDALNRFVDAYGKEIITLIDPKAKGFELLFMFVKHREMTLDYLVSEINSIDPKMDFAKLKSCSLEEIRQELISLKNKKYLDYYDAKYALTYLGNAVLRFFVGEE